MKDLRSSEPRHFIECACELCQQRGAGVFHQLEILGGKQPDFALISPSAAHFLLTQRVLP